VTGELGIGVREMDGRCKDDGEGKVYRDWTLGESREGGAGGHSVFPINEPQGLAGKKRRRIVRKSGNPSDLRGELGEK